MFHLSTRSSVCSSHVHVCGWGGRGRGYVSLSFQSRSSVGDVRECGLAVVYTKWYKASYIPDLLNVGNLHVLVHVTCMMYACTICYAHVLVHV